MRNKTKKHMSIVRYSPLNDFVPTSFNTLIDRFFNESVARSGGSAAAFVPGVDVAEDEKAFEIHLAVRGMNKEDFKIELNENENHKSQSQSLEIIVVINGACEISGSNLLTAKKGEAITVLPGEPYTIFTKEKV